MVLTLGGGSVFAQTASGITCNSVTLNGSVNINPSGTATEVWFEWGTTQSLGNSTTHQTMTTSGNFSQTLTTLSPNTTYYYRAVANNASSGTVQGSIISFTTIASCGGGTTGQATVTTNAAKKVTSNQAILNGTLNPNGTTNTVAWFEWGTTQSLGNSTAQVNYGPSQLNYNFSLGGLNPNTTYYFRAAAQTAGTQTVYGSILSFTTSGSGGGTTQPSVTTNNATNISQNSATMNGYVTPNGTANVWFEWGTNQSFGNTTSFQSVSNPGNMAFTLTSLSANTTY